MICRLCLNCLVVEESISIFKSKDICPGTQLYQMIAKYLNLELSHDDSISTNVCQYCVEHLKNFHIFWTLVDKKQNTFRNEFLEVKCDIQITAGTVDCKAESTEDIKNEPLIGAMAIEAASLEDEYECIDINNLKPNMEFAVADTIATNEDNDSFDEDAPLMCFVNKQKFKSFKMTRKKGSKKKKLLKNKSNAENVDDAKEKTGPLYRSRFNEEIIEGFMKLLCDLCKYSAATYRDLRQHFYLVHERAPFLKCCTSTYYKPSKLVEHINWHMNPEIFKCNICNKVLRTKSYLQKHKVTAHDKCGDYNDTTLNKHQTQKECNICKKKFRSHKCLENHISKHKNDIIHNCDKCQKGFATAQRLRRHRESIHDNLYSHVCDACGKKFKFKPSFEKHVLEHQGIVEPPEQCKLCGKWLKNKHSLRLHRFRHDNTDVTCHICARVCISRTALRGHINYMHKRRKDHQCDYCEKTFKEARNLEEHMAIHTGSNLYSCPHCAKECRSKSNMYVHIKRYHVEEWTKTKQARSNNPLYKSKTEDTSRNDLNVAAVRHT